MKKYFAYLLFALITFHSDASHAVVCSGALAVIVSTTGISFGVYNAGAATDTAVNGTVTVACTIQLGTTLPSFTVSLSSGGGSFAQRQMNFLVSNILKYNIYTTQSFTTVWGDGTGGTSTMSYDTGDGLSSKDFTAYGRIPKGQYVPTGLYGDSVTVSVTY
jgi:spore coat protein U-like protein